MKNIKKWIAHEYIIIPLLLGWIVWVVINYHQNHPDFYSKIKSLLESLSLFLYLILFILISFGLGHKIFKLFKLPLPLLETFLFSTGLGFGIFIYATFILGVVGGLYPISFYILILGSGLFAINEFPVLLIPSKVKTPPQKQKQKEGFPTFINFMLWITISFVIFQVVISALTPKIAWDSLVYHLNIPRLYLIQHQFYLIPYHVFSNFPLNVEMLYTIALALKGPCLAKLIHFTFGIFIALWLYAFSLKWFTHRIGLLAIVLFIANPVVIFEASRSYIDLALTFYCLLTIYGFFKWRESENGRWLILSAICGGIALGSKYTTVLVILPLTVGIFSRMYLADSSKIMPIVKKLALFLIIPFLFLLPWLIKNYIFTGNPVYPKFYSLFGGIYWDAELSKQFKDWMYSMGMGRGWLDYIKLPWNISIWGKEGHQFFDGTLTPLPLIFIPFLFFLPEISRIIIYLSGISLIFFIFWASGLICPQKLRFMMPILPLISLITAYSIENLSLCGKRLKKLYTTLYTFIFIILLSIIIPYLNDLADNLRVVVGLESKEEYLRRTYLTYEMFQYINNNLPKSAKLLFLRENRGYFCDRPYIACSFYEVSQVVKMIREAQTPEGLLKKLKEIKITHILLNKNLFFLFPYDKDAPELRIIEEFLGRYTELVYSKNNVDLFKIR